MSERAAFRGGRGGRGGGGRGGRGGSGTQGHPPSAGSQQQQERPKKESILDLAKYADKKIIVKFNGGREGEYPSIDAIPLLIALAVVGILKGYDQLLNLVLDEVEERLQGLETIHIRRGRALTDSRRSDANGATTTRTLGLLVARGTLLTSISPLDGTEEIANPFVNADDDDA